MSLDEYIYILFWYADFTTVLGDTPSAFGIDVVLHVTYGQTYVEAT